MDDDDNKNVMTDNFKWLAQFPFNYSFLNGLIALVGHSVLTVEVSRSHSDIQHSRTPLT
jgi:hypothetical protein